MQTEPFPTKLSVSTVGSIDSWSTSELSMTMTVKNEGSRGVTLLYRPETIGFDIIGPSGAFRCSWPTRPPAPIREMYTTIPANGRRSVSVILDDICPDDTFAQPGLFILRPRLDTREASGETIGLHTFDGEVIGTGTTILRIHHGTRPARTDRPMLE
jgi:hypothetical protein